LRRVRDGRTLFHTPSAERGGHGCGHADGGATMDVQSMMATLQRQPFVADFNSSQVESLAAVATETRFDTNQVVFREGEDCSQFYLIVSGRVSLEMAGQNETVHIETIGEGGPFGWSAILMGQGKYFQARALQPVTAIAFEGADLRAMCEKDTAFGYALMRRLLHLVAERLQSTRLQVLDMYWTPAKRAGA
jgi:CRP/FNR family transcriptional regulator, cyclic AMP receptor protein